MYLQNDKFLFIFFLSKVEKKLKKKKKVLLTIQKVLEL